MSNSNLISKKNLTTTLAFTILVSAGMFTGLSINSFAQEANFNSEKNQLYSENRLSEEEREKFKETKNQLRDAILAKDYEAWKTILKQLPNQGEKILSKIDNEEDFLIMAERRAERIEFREDLKSAIQDRNLEKFREVLDSNEKDREKLNKIDTQEELDKLADLQELIQESVEQKSFEENREKIKALREELGITGNFRKNKPSALRKMFQE